MRRPWMILLAIAGTAAGDAAPRAPAPGAAFATSLEAVAVDNVARSLVTGGGRIDATVQGDTLTVTGSFTGLASPAIHARLWRGVAVGVPGQPVRDLVVTPATSGTVSGTLRLAPALIRALRGSALYVQIDSEKAPDGTLWGWLMPRHAVPAQDVPETGPWFVQ